MSLWARLVAGATGLLSSSPLSGLLGNGTGADATRSIGFTIGVIVLCAKMAKADGRVTRDELAAFRRVFHVPEHETGNVAWLFDRAKRDADGFEPYARQLRRMLRGRDAVLEQLLDCLFVIAAADGHLHPEELGYLETVAGIFEVDRAAFARLRALHGAAESETPHAILGLPPDASPEMVTLRSRALAVEHHPDRLMAQGIPPEFIPVATRRMAAINAAYDAIVRRP